MAMLLARTAAWLPSANQQCNYRKMQWNQAAGAVGQRGGAVTVRAAAGPSGSPGMRSFEAPYSSNGSAPGSFSSSATPSSSSSATTVAAQPEVAALGAYRVSPWNAMKFSGPVPERVNGRLAMLSILYIAQQEMATGSTVLEQAQRLPTNYAAWPFVALLALFTYATFPPALAGAKEEDFGIFSVAAEKTNGRAAMLGLAVLAALEWHSGYCFF